MEKEGNYFLIEKEEEILASVEIVEHNEKISEFKNITAKEERILLKLLKEACKKVKSKRIYVKSTSKILEALQLTGFEEIKKNPPELSSGKYLAYDTIKNREDKSFSQIPDLVIIDGGKGQLTAGTKVFNKFDINIPYISLAKRLEEIFVPGNEQAILLEKNNEALKLVQRARDEAHRFAITFNKKLRSKRFQR